MSDLEHQSSLCKSMEKDVGLITKKRSELHVKLAYCLKKKTKTKTNILPQYVLYTDLR